VDLIRWALEQSLRKDGPTLAHVGLKRLDEARVTWWYERLRNVHFDSQDAISRIMALTSGLPFLLAEWDRLMPQQQEVGHAQLETICAQFADGFLDVVADLVGGPPALALTPREHELLRMAALAGRANGGEFNLREELAENWDILFREQMPDSPALYGHPEDEIAVSLLVEVGLLPVDGRGAVRFRNDDAVYRLIANRT
jgi:hypothetical protein